MDMVRKVEGNGCVLMRDPDHIRVSELLRLFVLNRDSLPAGKKGEPLQHWLMACAKQLEQNTDITLRELFARQTA